MEIWKDIPKFEGYYQVSNIGNVKSLSRSIPWNNRIKRLSGNNLKPKNDKDGYKAVRLTLDGKSFHLRVHRLVLMAFVGMPPCQDSLGMHLDDNPANNIVENLKWGDNSENMRMAIANGKKPPTRAWLGKFGKDHHTSKIIYQYSLSGDLINTFSGGYEAFRQTNINRSCICECCNGRRLTAGGYIWKYNSV